MNRLVLIVVCVLLVACQHAGPQYEDSDGAWQDSDFPVPGPGDSETYPSEEPSPDLWTRLSSDDPEETPDTYGDPDTETESTTPVDPPVETDPYTPPPVIDDDGDGWFLPIDCNDSDASIHPDADDVPGSGIDANCDGMVTELDTGEYSWGNPCMELNPPPYCSTTNHICGDGVIAPGWICDEFPCFAHEECDDGNLIPGDGCNGNCELEYCHVCPIPGEPCSWDAACDCSGFLDCYEENNQGTPAPL